MTKLPIPLRLKTVTTKVSSESWSEIQELAKKHGFRISDVLAACIVIAQENEIVALLKEQQEVIERIPKPLLGIMRNQERLSDHDRQMLIEALQRK